MILHFIVKNILEAILFNNLEYFKDLFSNYFLNKIFSSSTLDSVIHTAIVFKYPVIRLFIKNAGVVILSELPTYLNIPTPP